MDALHDAIEKGVKFWQSEECYNNLKTRILEAANGTVTKPMIARAVQAYSAEMNAMSREELIVKGNEKALGLTEKEAQVQFDQVFNVYMKLDPALQAKSWSLQGIITRVIPKLSEDLGALTGKSAAAALADQAIAALPAPSPEWTDGADLELVVYIDREFDLSIPLRAPRGCKVRDLKKLLSEADDSGIAVDQVFFRAPGQEYTTHDDCLVTDLCKELDLVEAEILPAGYVNLSRKEAMKMLRELAEGFALPSFQNILNTAKRKNGLESSEFIVARAQAALEVQKKIIAKYGFKAHPIGVKHMMASMAVYNLDPETRLLNDFINEKFNPI